MSRRLNYANVMATLALFFALSGGALAAKHYLINSASQINPKVLKRLTGKTGPTGTQGREGGLGKEGAAGKEGPVGREGKPGQPGLPGPFPTTLPAGKSLYGYMTIFGDGTTIAATSAAFLYPLASVPAVHFIAAGASTPPGCLGDSTNPGAESGNLCIFEFQKSNVVSAGENGPVSDNTADTRGFAVWANGAAAGQFYDKVRWAVTG